MNEIEKQFIVVDRLLQDDGDVQTACQEFTLLLKLFYKHLEKKKPEPIPESVLDYYRKLLLGD